MIRRASLSSDAIDEIEGFLCAEREWNMANECLSSETAVIDRLLASRDSLRGVYAKLTEVPASVRERRLRRLITSSPSPRYGDLIG